MSENVERTAGAALAEARGYASPRTDQEASDGWSGDAICVSDEFARGLEQEIEEAKAILRAELDRDYDETDTLRILVTVAVNALHAARHNAADQRPGHTSGPDCK